MGNFKSVVALDLGALYAGSFFLNYEGNTQISSANARAVTLVLPKDQSSLTFSSTTRRAARHRLRNMKRFKFARRILTLVIREQITQKKISIGKEEQKKLFEALSGLLKRRGYSRVETEVEDIEILDFLEPEIFANYKQFSLFNDRISLLEQWENISQDIEKVKSLHQSFIKDGHKFFSQWIKENYPEITVKEKKEYEKGYMTIKHACDAIIEKQVMGHKHRSVYLADIKKEIQKDSRLIPAIQLLGSADALYCLIGNISNLQLRAERWYFNAPEMLKEDRWNPSRFKKSIVRAYKYFHPQGTNEEKKQLLDLIQRLENSDDILRTLCEIDPLQTIPPYEDQNNRRPPLDRTLFLNPHVLNTKFQDQWKLWVRKLLEQDSSLEENLDLILQYVDRKSRTKASKITLPLEDYRASYILQRVLDRSMLRDPYALRRICEGEISQKLQPAYTLLERVLGRQHVEEFLKFASAYYKEVRDARAGLWVASENTLLESANIHPPRKEKILDTLVGNVFGKDRSFGVEFQNTFWHQRVGRKTLKSICEAIEETRKNYGNEFNITYQKVLRGSSLITPEDNKEMTAIIAAVKDTQEFFRNEVKLSENTINRIANPYSLAQLYTLIETERKGFTSCSIAAHLENSWRMSDGGNSNQGAQCSRLSTDAVRPFDGILRKVLDRQTWEIAKIQAEEIKKQSLKNSTIDAIFIVEQNKFEFSSSLGTLKNTQKGRRTADNAGKMLKRQAKGWSDKKTRLQMASKAFCPYTGKPLTGLCEVDHIIPRSKTTKEFGTIFNSEANLIYVSQEGNLKKGKEIYTLANLKDPYLKAVFGTSDRKLIQNTIEETVSRLLKNGDLPPFDALTDIEQRDVRHALFLPFDSDIRMQAIRALGKQNQTFVNGTQAWLIRSVIDKLTKELTSWCKTNENTLRFHAWKTDPYLASKVRTALGNANPKLRKPEEQPVASHSIDGLCSFAISCGDDRLIDILETDGEFSNTEDAQKLALLYPETCEVRHIERKDLADKQNHDSLPIFKEGILGENFLHIMTLNHKVYVGFSLPKKNETSKNAIEVTGKNPWKLMEQCAAYLKETVDVGTLAPKTYHIDKTKVYELFARIYHEESTDEEKEVASLLWDLHYFTSRTNLASCFIEKNKIMDSEQFLKEDNFSIKIDYKSNKDIAIKGSVLFPAFYSWQETCAQLELNGLKGQSPDSLDLRKLNRTTGSNRPHSPTRRDLSLPLLSKASGFFRIKRKTAAGENVYQTVNINGVKYKGFSVNSSGLDWSTPVMFNHLRGKNLTAEDGYLPLGSDVVSMTHWEQVNTNDEKLKVWIAPGSRQRCMIRVETNFDMIYPWFDFSLKELGEFAVPASCKVNEKNYAGNLSEEDKQLLGKPRGEVHFEKVGKQVRFYYNVVSSNAKMKKAFSDAFKTKN